MVRVDHRHKVRFADSTSANSFCGLCILVVRVDMVRVDDRHKVRVRRGKSNFGDRATEKVCGADFNA